MYKALVIEFSIGAPNPEIDWIIITNNSHGNTVRNTFLSFAQSGWSCDVRQVRDNDGFYDYVSKLQETPYDLIICSYILDVNWTNSLDKIGTDLGIPLFMPMPNSGDLNTNSFRRFNCLHVGSEFSGTSIRADTWDIATNLNAPNNNFTSYTNAVVAGKATKLIDAGFTYLELYEAIREQSSQFPDWDNRNGYGKAPESFSITLPTPIEPIPEPDPIPDPIPEPPYIPNSTLKLSPFFL